MLHLFSFQTVAPLELILVGWQKLSSCSRWGAELRMTKLCPDKTSTKLRLTKTNNKTSSRENRRTHWASSINFRYRAEKRPG